MLDQMTLFISAVAAISLFIAGVGVMNMMYISVSERTKEIGIRRALSANAKSIKRQFLFEGIVLTVSGGVIGYILGILIAFAASFALPFSVRPDMMTVLISIGTSVVIGVCFSNREKRIDRYIEIAENSDWVAGNRCSKNGVLKIDKNFPSS